MGIEKIFFYFLVINVTKVKQRKHFIHVASREKADVYVYVTVRDQFSVFSCVNFIRNILSKFCFRSRKKGAFTLSSSKITVV